MVGGTVCGRVLTSAVPLRVFRSHTRTDPSCAPATICVPSGLKARPVTAFGLKARPVTAIGLKAVSPNWPAGLAVLGSHNLIVPSLPADAILLPSRLNATALTLPCAVGIGSPPITSHSRTEPSTLPDTTRVPAHLTDVTSP